MGAMRLFSALIPSELAMEDLEEFLSPRREHGAFRWTLAEQFHLTLGFHEQVSERALDGFVESLSAAAAKRTPFDLTIAGGGAYPHPAGARVLIARLDGDESALNELDRLAAGCRAAANRVGVVVDGQRFRPHLTVARLGRPREVSRWVRLLDAYRGPPWTADRVVLIRSYLGEGPRRRPRYEAVAEFPFSSAPISS